MDKDWTGNSRSAHATLGARNYAKEEREKHDYYATEPKAATLLMDLESLSPLIWECACGGGHISDVLKKNGYCVYSSDLINRGYNGTIIQDFLKTNNLNTMDIITNPPYKYAKEFVEHALDISADGVKVAMFLKLTFLESKSRKALFKKYPFKTLYVSSARLQCAKNGDFEKFGKGVGTAVAYGWYVWEKGFTGKPTIEWI